MIIPKSAQIAIAIKTIRPKAQFSNGENYASLVWNDTEQTKPTEEEYNQAVIDYDAKQYQRDRLQTYPNTNDLIVALWEKVVEGRSESADALELKRQGVRAN